MSDCLAEQFKLVAVVVSVAPEVLLLLSMTFFEHAQTDSKNTNVKIPDSCFIGLVLDQVKLTKYIPNQA